MALVPINSSDGAQPSISSGFRWEPAPRCAGPGQIHQLRALVMLVVELIDNLLVTLPVQVDIGGEDKRSSSG